MKKQICLQLIFFVIMILFITLSEAVQQQDKSQNKKKKQRKKKEVIDKRPSNIEPDLYCNSCQAIVRETLKKIRDSKKEYDIIDALSNICSDRNYPNYEYPPPDMKKGCESFMGSWNDVIESGLIKRTNNNDIEQEICITKTKACIGGTNKKKNGIKSDNFVTVNGKKMKVDPNGSVDMKQDPYEDF